MKQSPRLRSPRKLAQSIHAQLNTYTLAASAAGVAILALAQPLEANGIYSLDLNHDGIIDFLILESGYATFNGTAANNTLLAKEALGNAVEGRRGKSGQHFASALKPGAPIGPGEPFISGGANGESMARTWVSDLGGGQSGQWLNVTDRYLGLKFKIDGKTHYGWARLSVDLPGNFNLSK